MCACVLACVCVRACVCVCKHLPGNQSFDRQLFAHKKGGVMNPDQQLLTSLLHDIDWGPLEHSSRGPQLMSCIIYVCVHVCNTFSIIMHRAYLTPASHNH